MYQKDKTLTTAILLSLIGTGSVQAKSAAKDDIETIEVISPVIEYSKGPTGLNLSEKDTPQSISIIDSAMIENYQLETIEEVLANTTGITTQQNNCCKGSNIYSRGFYLNNLVKDGIASASYTFQDYHLDPVIYERVEVVKGAPGFMQGAGILLQRLI